MRYKVLFVCLLPTYSLLASFWSYDAVDNCEMTQNTGKEIMDQNTPLNRKKCIPCESNMPPLKGAEITALYNQLAPGWKVVEEHHLEKEYKFSDFKTALAYVNRVGEVAEQEGHHPDIYLAWGKVKIQLWTHKIKGLSESDFIMAAKCDEVL